MSWSARIWIVLALGYAAFFSWYTSFGGPLSDEEIATFMQVLADGGAPPERLAKFRQFMESDTGDDFAMLNAIDLRDVPTPGPGIEPGDTSEEVLAKYSSPFMGRGLRSGIHPVFMGTAAAPALDVWGIEGASEWDVGALVRYRSRRDVMQQIMWMREAGADDIHHFKIAAMEKTIAFPVDPWFQLGDPRLVLALLLLIVGLSTQLALTRAAAR